jgi:hypothetical protein
MQARRFGVVLILTLEFRSRAPDVGRAGLSEPLPRRSARSGFVDAPGLVLGRVASTLDEVPSEILFRGEGVVSAAAKRDVVQAMLAPLRESERVM